MKKTFIDFCNEFILLDITRLEWSMLTETEKRKELFKRFENVDLQTRGFMLKRFKHFSTEKLLCKMQAIEKNIIKQMD